MENWSLKKEGFRREDVAADGNRFLCANGYMGLRGTAEEAGSEQFAAVTLAGVYDRNGDLWREPVNAPHGLSARLYFDGQFLSPENTGVNRHETEIDYGRGVYSRDTDFGPVRLQSERFVSMADCHLMADRLTILVLHDGKLEIRTGISTDIWDINGPHLYGFRYNTGKTLLCGAETGEKHITVVTGQTAETDFKMPETFETGMDGVYRVWRRNVRAGEKITVSLFASVYTSLDGGNPERSAAENCLKASRKGFPVCLREHEEAWEKIRNRSEVCLKGNDRAALALRASQYHLNSIAPRHANNMSIAARGLSGQTYKGAVFWDSEIFLLPMFVYTQPEIARSLLTYRIETLPGALKKAAEYGFRGAFYAWESQEGGEEGCTDFNVVDVFTHRPVRTYFRDKQIHISADIAYALRSYYEITGDRSLLEQGGAAVILECARFYLSRANTHADRDTADFADVIGPDEYHERVTNNAFTNRMALYCIESALQLKEIFRDRQEWFDALLKERSFEKDWELLKRLVTLIRKPVQRNGITEQFDGYFELEDCTLEEVRGRLRDPREYWGGDHGVAGTTQIIKQADVITLMALFPEEYSDAEVDANWAYYEPRTEHGSSLSACMYALTACRTGRLEEAWDLFLRTASIDITGGGKQWAGEIYIGGTHPASNGGAWMIAALGFAGLRMRNGEPELHPKLPRHISRLSFPFTAKGRRMTAEVSHEGFWIKEA